MSLPESKWQELMWLCEQKIWIKPPEGKGPISWAINGGHYLGAPGKEIYSCLSKLDEEQWNELADKHSEQWPRPKEGEPYKTPGNHVGYAACIRYIYGQFEKQGTLRSKQDKSRMINQGVDWSLPRKFMKTLKQKWESKKCYYGLTIAYEMEGHRIGDEAVVYNDKSKLDSMEKAYLKSVEFAQKCNSYKQMFTPYYWATMYFIEMKDHKRAGEFAARTIDMAEKYCPDARGSYVNKLMDCANYMINKHPGAWRKFSRRLEPNVKNRCVSKMYGKLNKKKKK